MVTSKWISIAQYAKKYNLNRTKIYWQIYSQKWPEGKSRKVIVENQRIEVLDEPVDRIKKEV